MNSAPDTSLKPLSLASLAAQIADKANIDEMLCYETALDWKDFKANRRIEVEMFHEAIVGGDRPYPSKFVVSLDHLNKVSSLRIHDTLDELKRLTEGIGLFHVGYDELDPRDTNQPYTWWIREFTKRWDLQTFQRLPGGFYVIVYPKSN